MPASRLEPTSSRPPARQAATPLPTPGPLPLRSSWPFLLACVVILFVRKTDSFLNSQFWAEDGPVYFMTARIEGARSIVRPFDAPYVIHRLIAYAGSFVPVRYAPHFYVYASLMVTLAVLAYITQARIPSRYGGWMALAVVSMPHTGEVYLFLSNLHWILALAMLMMAISQDPATRIGKIVEGAVLLLMCTDGYFVFLYGPLFVLRAWRFRTTYSMVLVALVALGLAWQLGAFRALFPVMGNLSLLRKSDQFVGQFNPADPQWLAFWGNCLSGVLLLGRSMTEQLPNSALLSLLTITLYAWLILYGLRAGDWTYFGFLWGIFSVLATLTYMYRKLPIVATVSPGGRYSLIPYVCTVWLLLLLIERRGPRERRLTPLLVTILAAVCAVRLGILALYLQRSPVAGLAAMPFAAALVMVIALWILLLVIERDPQSMRWTAALLAGGLLVLIAVSSLAHFHFPPLEDLHWAEKSRCIGGPEPCDVPINAVPPWRIHYDPRYETGGQAPEPTHE